MDRLTRSSILLMALVAVPVMLASQFLYAGELRTLDRVLTLALFGYALNILVHNTGIISFGHALFYGGGAYTVALLWLHWEVPAEVGLLVAPFACALLALITAPLVFRGSGLFFALLTLAVAQVFHVIVIQWYSVTNGENGIHGVPAPAFLGSLEARHQFVAAVVLAVVALLRVVTLSPFGATLRGIRDNRERAMFLGIHVRRYELAAHCISAAAAGVAGALTVMITGSAFPTQTHWSTSALPLIAIAIGGMSSHAGPLIGAAFIVALQDVFRSATDHANLVYGVAVLLVALGLRDGIAGGLSALKTLAVRAWGHRSNISATEPGTVP